MSIYHSAQNTIFQEQLLNNYQIIIRLAFNCSYVYSILSCLVVYDYEDDTSSRD